MGEIVRHRFQNHQIHPETETLIVGTFNPDTPENQANFFYSTGRNFLWTLLPKSFDEEGGELKGADKAEKINFIHRKKVDFIDLISAVQVDRGMAWSRSDKYIDAKVIEWRDVCQQIEKLGSLKRVAVTRKGFSDVPRIRSQVEGLEDHLLKSREIRLCRLISPARFYSPAKQMEWRDFLHSK